MNRAILMGRLTADPELKSTPNGTSVLNFTLAVNRRFKNEQGQYDTDFINCTAWRGTAEFVAKYFSKGKMIAIAGSIQTRNYEDKQGNKRTAVEVVCDEAYFCGKESGTVANSAPEQGNFETIDDDSELPF